MKQNVTKKNLLTQKFQMLQMSQKKNEHKSKIKQKKTKRIQKQKHKTTRKNSRTSHNLYSPMSLCDS